MQGKLIQPISVVKYIVVLLILLLCSTPTNVEAKSASEISISVGPSLNFQYIMYNSENYQNRNTLGPGLSFSFDYALSNTFDVGTTVSYEYESYKNFYSYHDLKVSVNATLNLLSESRQEPNVYLSVLLGSGVDFVFRNDGDFGAYILSRSGLILNVRMSEKTDFVFKPVFEFTFQNGSTLFHSSTVIGVRVKLGGVK